MSQNTHTHDHEVDFFVQCYRYLRATADQLCRCRECHSPCGLLSSICETCGTQDPVQLPWRWALLAGLGCLVLWLLGIWII